MPVQTCIYTGSRVLGSQVFPGGRQCRVLAVESDPLELNPGSPLTGPVPCTRHLIPPCLRGSFTERSHRGSRRGEELAPWGGQRRAQNSDCPEQWLPRTGPHVISCVTFAHWLHHCWPGCVCEHPLSFQNPEACTLGTEMEMTTRVIFLYRPPCWKTSGMVSLVCLKLFLAVLCRV